jgi:hypothetical protein
VSAHTADHAVHFIAGLKASHGGPHLNDSSCPVQTENGWQRLLGVPGLSRSDLRVEDAHTGRCDFYEHLTGLQLPKRRSEFLKVTPGDLDYPNTVFHLFAALSRAA